MRALAGVLIVAVLLVGILLVNTLLVSVEPSATSSVTSPAWALLGRSIREVLGNEIIVAPYLLFAGTDSKHFAPIAEDVYRFFALTVTPEDVARFHGIDERIAVRDYEKVVAVYHQVLKNLSQLQ